MHRCMSFLFLFIGACAFSYDPNGPDESGGSGGSSALKLDAGLWGEGGASALKLDAAFPAAGGSTTSDAAGLNAGGSTVRQDGGGGAALPGAGGSGASSGALCTDAKFPVRCPARSGVAAACWGSGTECSTVTKCGNEPAACGKDEAGRIQRPDCAAGVCFACPLQPDPKDTLCGQCIVEKCCATLALCAADNECKTAKSGPLYQVYIRCAQDFCATNCAAKSESSAGNVFPVEMSLFDKAQTISTKELP